MRELEVDLQHLRGAIGGTVYGVGGERIGKLAGVYLDDESSQPEWIEVKTGLVKRRFVPLESAQVAERRVDVPYERRLVDRTPKVKPKDGLVLPYDEDRLYHYYGLTGDDHHAHPLRPLQSA
ncbi:MAG: PRC-barrel domain-containing protein [Micromonosporaceae bacterium]